MGDTLIPQVGDAPANWDKANRMGWPSAEVCSFRQLDKRLDLINPSFDSWDFSKPMTPGRVVPEGWEIFASPCPNYYADVERFAAISQYSLKVQGSGTPGRVYVKQTVQCLRAEYDPKSGGTRYAPNMRITEYGIVGWVLPFEVLSIEHDHELRRMRVGFAIGFGSLQYPETGDNSKINWIPCVENRWNRFHSIFVKPKDVSKVTLWLVHENVHPGINISYWDRLDDTLIPHSVQGI